MITYTGVEYKWIGNDGFSNVNIQLGLEWNEDGSLSIQINTFEKTGSVIAKPHLCFLLGRIALLIDKNI